MLSQSLEPRLYSNAPLDMNFLAAGYAFSKGTLPDNPELDIKDADLNVNTAVLAYSHVIGMFGQSGKVDVIIPGVCMDGNGIYKGEYTTRESCGIGDIKGRFSLNVYGAPALSLKEFGSYQQDLIVGVSLQVSAPTGKYESAKLINIGNNRWAFKPSVGVSQAWGDMILELSTAAEFYTDNSQFFGSNRREQDPIYSIQTHLIYTFSPGLWLGVDGNYYWGGKTKVNALDSSDTLEDSRYGVTLSIPVDKKNSLKFYNNSGVFTRTGTDFDMVGFTWLYRFGGGD